MNIAKNKILGNMTDAGFFGIGTEMPYSKVHIANSRLDSSYIGLQDMLRLQSRYSSAGSGALIRFTQGDEYGVVPNAGEFNLAGIAAINDVSNWGGSLYFQTTGGTSGGSDLQNRMVIKSTGNVGIGITSPTQLLHVNGTAIAMDVCRHDGNGNIISGSCLSGIQSIVSSGYGTQGFYTSYATPGSYSWVVPAGVTSVNVEVWGAGGGGGIGAATNGASTGGGGGGSGGYSKSVISVTPGQTYTVVVGAGGTVPASYINAGTGSFSSFAGNSSLVKAYGGLGGRSSYNAIVDYSVSPQYHCNRGQLAGLNSELKNTTLTCNLGGSYYFFDTFVAGASAAPSGEGDIRSAGNPGANIQYYPVAYSAGGNAPSPATTSFGRGGVGGGATVSAATGNAGAVVISAYGYAAAANSMAALSSPLVGWPGAIICGNRVQYLEIVNTAGNDVRYRGFDGAYTIFAGNGNFSANYTGATCPAVPISLQTTKAN